MLLFSFRLIMQTPLAPHSTYWTICHIFNSECSGKCKFLAIRTHLNGDLSLSFYIIITQPHLECSNGYISIKQIKMQLLLDKRVVLVHIHGKKKESMHQNRKLRLLSMCKPCIFILNAPSIKISRPHWNKKLTVGNIFFLYKNMFKLYYRTQFIIEQNSLDKK